MQYGPSEPPTEQHWVGPPPPLNPRTGAPARRKSKAPVIIAILAVLAVLLCAGGVVGSLLTNVGPDSSDEPFVVRSAGSGDAYAQAAPTTQPHQSSPATPLTSFRDGTYEVGTRPGQIQPGTYVSVVPKQVFDLCIWQRLKGFSGEGKDIISMGSGNEGDKQRVTIAVTDAGFETKGCGEWSRA